MALQPVPNSTQCQTVQSLWNFIVHHKSQIFDLMHWRRLTSGHVK